MLKPIVMLAVLTISLIGLPIAQAAPPAYQFIPGIGYVSMKALEKAGIKNVTKVTAEGKITYQMSNEAFEHLFSLQIETAGKEGLKEFRPSMLKLAGWISNNKLKQFPVEAFNFFIAIGAINTANLVFDFERNPVALDQHIETQKDPIGHLGFASFMVANGLVAEPLMNLVQSKTLRYFIPYLGMSVGMMASNVVHEIGHLPKLKECAAKFDAKDCDEAYANFKKLWSSEKMHEYAPTLVSMISSTAASGLLEMGVNTAARMTLQSIPKGAIVRFIGVQMLFALVPGGVAVKSVQLAYQAGKYVWTVAKLGTFVYLDQVFIGPIDFAYKNAVTLGPDLKAADQRMANLYLRKSQLGWKPETGTNVNGQSVCLKPEENNCYFDLQDEITRFGDLMEKWRQANMSQVLTAHSNWSQYLSKISLEYRVAKKFYFDFVTDTWALKNQIENPSEHVMRFSMPLYGVTPKGLTAEQSNLYIYDPVQVQKKQMETVRDSVTQLNLNSSGMSELMKTYFESDRQILLQIWKKLNSVNPQVVGQGLMDLRYHAGLDFYTKPSQSSAALRQILFSIFRSLGNPKPLITPGLAYLRLMDSSTQDPDNSTNPFTTTEGFFVTSTANEYILTRMLMGPDVEAGELSVKKGQVSGFLDSFDPPMIRVEGKISAQRIPQEPNVPFDVAQSVVTTRVDLNGTTYKNVYELFLNGGMRESVLGDKESGHKIGEWWEKYPEKELLNVWLDYEQKYEPIVQDLFDALISLKKSTFNRGNFSNGILKSLEEERMVYLYLLEKLQQPTQKNGILAQEQTASVLEMARGTRDSKTDWISAQWQAWDGLVAKLGKISKKPVQKKKGQGFVLVSRVSNSEVDAMNDEIAEVLNSALKKMTGLNDYQKALAEKLVKALERNQNAFADLVKIVNSASYVELIQGDLNSLKKKRCVEGTGRTSSMAQRAPKQNCSPE